MTSPRSHSQSWPSWVWNPGPPLLALCSPRLFALFQVGRKARRPRLCHLFAHPPSSSPRQSPLTPRSPTPCPRRHPRPLSPLAAHPSSPSHPAHHAAGPGGEGTWVPLPAPPGGTHRGQGAARGCRRHCCQRPGQEPPHAWKSVQRHRPSSPGVHLSGELGRDWPAHQEHQIRLFPQPLGVLLKQDLTSGVRTNPAFSSEKNFSCLSLLFFFLPSVPTSSPGLAGLPGSHSLKGEVTGL